MDVLLDQQERDTLVGQAALHGHRFIHQDRRDAEKRCVEQHGFRIAHQRPADRQHLLPTAAQRAGPVGELLGERREQIEDAFEANARPDRAVGLRETRRRRRLCESRVAAGRRAL